MQTYSVVSLQFTDFSIRTFALQTYRVLTVHNAYNTKTQKFQAGPLRHKLSMSLKFVTSPLRRYRSLKVLLCVTNLRCSLLAVHNGYNANIQKLEGGLSRYKVVVRFKFTSPTLRTYGKFRVDVRVTS